VDNLINLGGEVVHQPTTQPEDSITGDKYYEPKMRQFRTDYNHEEVAWMIAELGERFQPEREVTMADIRRDYPHYEKLLRQDAALDEFVATYADELQPFLQAPFPLPSGQVIQGPWLGQYKLAYFTRCGITAETISGKRVLDIGSNAGFDTFYLSTLGPREIVGIEPSALFYYQALFLWAVYDCPNLTFHRLRWQEAKDGGLGTFDVVNCQGILYHEPNPMQLVDAVFELLAPGGTFVLETHISLGDEQTARFIEGPFWGDNSWFWLPTLKTLAAMLRSRGFEDIIVRDSFTVDSKNPCDPERAIEGELVGGRAFLTATKPTGRVYAPKFGLV
jgi:SAM-dependent methyltransferase